MEQVADLIADMVRAGVDADLIGRTAAAFALRSPVTDEQAERRREKDRARKQAARDAEKEQSRPQTSADSAESMDNADTVSLSPIPLLSPTPPNNPLTPKPIQKTNSRGTRLPDDWHLGGPDLAYALTKGLTEFETGELAERFKSWALSASGSNAVKRNWHQAWQGWVQRDGPKIIAARAGPRGSFAKPLSPFQQSKSGTQDILDGLKAFAAGSGSSSSENHRMLPGGDRQ